MQRQVALFVSCTSLLACSASDDGSTPSSDVGVTGSGGDGGTVSAGAGGAQNGGASGTIGAQNGGAPGTGGSAGAAGTQKGGSSNQGGASGTGGSAGGGGQGGALVPVKCANGGSSTLPANAPALQAGVWKDISPSQAVFTGDVGNGAPFTQGITLVPCNSSTLYLSVVSFTPDKGEAGLYRSTDAGSSWKKIGQLDEPINVVVDPANPQHLYASDGVRGGTGGFWVSNDGGDTWTQPAGFKSVTPNTDGYHVDADPADFSHVLFSYHSGWPGDTTGVLESKDGGNTWTKHEVPGSGGCGCDAFFLNNPALGIGDSNTWLYGTQGTGYWRTKDGGQTWTKVNNTNMEHGGATIYYSKKGVLYASAAGYILRSTNNGESFTDIAPQNGYLSILGDGQHLYTAGHGGGAYVTALENDDTNWTTYGSGKTFLEGPFQMAYDAANDILYAGNIRSGAWALKLH
jgi:hypothetical protein